MTVPSKQGECGDRNRSRAEYHLFDQNDIKTLRNILACVCGLAVLSVAIYSSVTAGKMRVVLSELGGDALPLQSRIFLSVPSFLYVLFGLVIGAILAWSTCKAEPPWASLPIAALTIVFLFAYLGIFSFSLLKPIEPNGAEIKILRNMLACVCGLAVFGVAIYSGVITEKVRVVLSERSGVTLPFQSRIFLSVPSFLYVLFGLVIGVILAWSICKAAPPWASPPITVLTAVFLFAYLGIFSFSLLKPIRGLIVVIETNDTKPVEQSPASDSLKAGLEE